MASLSAVVRAAFPDLALPAEWLGETGSRSVRAYIAGSVAPAALAGSSIDLGSVSGLTLDRFYVLSSTKATTFYLGTNGVFPGVTVAANGFAVMLCSAPSVANSMTWTCVDHLTALLRYGVFALEA